jgi:hypothetical protein
MHIFRHFTNSHKLREMLTPRIKIKPQKCWWHGSSGRILHSMLKVLIWILDSTKKGKQKKKKPWKDLLYYRCPLKHQKQHEQDSKNSIYSHSYYHPNTPGSVCPFHLILAIGLFSSISQIIHNQIPPYQLQFCIPSLLQ